MLLKRGKSEEISKGGIIIPGSAQEKSVEAEVLAVGDGKVLVNGTRVPPNVKPGDVVLLSKWGGTEVKVSGNEYMIVTEEDILGVVER